MTKAVKAGSGSESDPATVTSTDPGARALKWWRRHCDPLEGDSGTRAKLRRSRSRVEASAVPAAVSLVQQLAWRKGDSLELDRRVGTTLDLARVLSHVRQHVMDKSPMRAAGWSSFPGDRRESEAGDERPRLSEVRFRRLLATADGEEQVSAFVRLITLLDGKVKIDTLASNFLDWTHPARGDGVRQRWAFDYYAAGVAAPSTTPNAVEGDEE